uniref:Autophagy-related protein 101 n=1 Tax=Oryza punctata TaxID=4537 RepID=A0A0E0MLX0_ORYPU
MTSTQSRTHEDDPNDGDDVADVDAIAAALGVFTGERLGVLVHREPKQPTTSSSLPQFVSSIHPSIHPFSLSRRDTHQQLRRRRRQPRRPRVAEMNCETCQLKELELEPREIKDVLRCILHTIFFHRTLSLVRPKDVDCDFFEITYVQCGLPELEKEVDEKINQFVAWVEKHPNRSSQVCLSFFDEKNKLPSWFGNKTERIYWEQWFINLHVISPKRHSKSRSSKALTNIGGNFIRNIFIIFQIDILSFTLWSHVMTLGQALEESSSRRAALESSIHEVLFQIINFANEKKDHIPPIPDRIFNHEISIPRANAKEYAHHSFYLR